MTYHPLSDDSLQEIFNKAYLGLKSQGFVKCEALEIDEYTGQKEPVCLYTLNGNHCAIGWVCDGHPQLPENVTPNRDDVREFLGIEIDESRIAFLFDLQQQHDMALTPAGMEMKLRDFAKRYGLTVPE